MISPGSPNYWCADDEMWLEPGFHEELIEIEASLTPSSSPNHSKRSRDHESDDSHWTSQLPSTSNSATMPTTPTSLTVQHSSLPASSSSQGTQLESGKGKARDSDEVEGDCLEVDAAPLVPGESINGFSGMFISSQCSRVSHAQNLTH